MATKQLLIQALKRTYDRVLFAKEVLNPVFGAGFTFYQEPVLSAEQPNKTELQVIQGPVYRFGEIKLEDNTDVNCYEIKLQPQVRVEQSRVAIQHFVRKLLTAGQAALVNFISPKTEDSLNAIDDLYQFLNHEKFGLKKLNRKKGTTYEELQRLL